MDLNILLLLATARAMQAAPGDDASHRPHKLEGQPGGVLVSELCCKTLQNLVAEMDCMDSLDPVSRHTCSARTYT